MRKFNNKGFFLAETIVVITIAATVLILFYNQVANLYHNYQNNANYDTVESIHAVNNVKKIILDEGLNTMITALGTDDYIDITDYAFTDADYYNNLKTTSNIEKIYFTKYDLNTLITNAYDEGFDAEFITYLKTLKTILTEGIDNTYRIIIKLTNNVYSSLRINDLTEPVLTLNGDDTVILLTGGAYSDAGATAIDNIDGDITSDINVISNLDPNTAGTYTMTYNVTDSDGNTANSIVRLVRVIDETYAYDYIGNYQTFKVPITGNYQIELWGAQGGTVNYGGKGAYTKGQITLTEGNIIYIYVGGQPQDVTEGGYNGGGIANSDGRYKSGGGATDIRLVNGNWNDAESLRSRIMVAAGGGGDLTNSALPGGAGGALIGIEGGRSSADSDGNFITLAQGGTQTAGGAGGTGSYANGNPGSFGTGGNGVTSYIAAGGGGYYGGGSSAVAMNIGGTGAGGSSFASGHTGCDAINSSGTHTGQPNHYSGYVFTNTQMIDGNTSMPAPAGGTQTGHSGNGYAKITYIPNSYQFAYTGSPQTWHAPVTGTYKIELWGASGGTYGNNAAYTSGEIDLTKGTVLYLYVGSKGVARNNTCLGGYNGGGNSMLVAPNFCGSTGGGGTDVRLSDGTWNNTTSLRSRIMVAAGGGGTGTTVPSGQGGGLVGYVGDVGGSYPEYQGLGGTQTAGGAVPTQHGCATAVSTAGSFGAGGTGGPNQLVTTTGGGGGGGGGYYGGSGSSGLCNGGWSGGGGSSFISGHSGCNAINSSGTHTGQPNHYSGYVFTSTQMIDGASSMPAPVGGTETGHDGNGQAKITYIPSG